MTSQGHPYSIFRRAIDRRMVSAAWAAAHDLGSLNLRDAFDLAVLVAEQEPARFDPVAVRWLGRFALEARGLTLSEFQLVAACLDALTREHDRAPALRLLKERLCLPAMGGDGLEPPSPCS